ncbi:helix-turn-helix domain-containing protein [Paenibacillus woosongensis]|uniref:HTH cro/C1-type domain-containing protein n=1 Tax=Paenibacillus woosongensis TaxID=307580 RepID=A0ABQ4MXC9_9BACL|nr:helix-turn-helix transcriptional regulator [Paenibacillus woosongensis]GIP60580.1 hypothetical protein J15TS10_43940 [Paenibacillus woosongensis]
MDSLEKAKEFGQYLKGLRTESKLTLKQLSEKTKLTIGHLSNIENGRRGIPSPNLLKKLAEPLNVPYGELMYHADYLSNDSDLSEQEREGLEFQLLYLPNGEVLRGEEASAYMRSQGLFHSSIEEAEEAGKKAEELEMLIFLNKDITLYGYRLTKDERKRIAEMLDLMFPQYVSNKDEI